MYTMISSLKKTKKGSCEIGNLLRDHVRKLGVILLAVMLGIVRSRVLWCDTAVNSDAINSDNSIARSMGCVGFESCLQNSAGLRAKYIYHHHSAQADGIR